MQEQQRQRRRLKALVKKCEKNRDILLNKLNHAEVMNNMLENTMVETTGEYKKRKKELLDLIMNEKNEKEKFEKIKLFKLDIVAKVRISLRQLQQLCKIVKTERRQSKMMTPTKSDDAIVAPKEDESDGKTNNFEKL